MADAHERERHLLRSEERDRAVLLAGFLRGLAWTSRHAFEPYERDALRDAAGLLARSIGRAELAAAPPTPIPVGQTPVHPTAD